MSSSKAVDDLWRRTLSQIETVFGRLEYLASLRNTHTGRYEHFGLGQRFGAEASEAALRHSHEQVFGDWVSFPLQAQKQEIHKYLEGREEQLAEIISSWLRVKPFASWVPAKTRTSERLLFLTDLDVLLELIRRENGVGAPDQDA